MPLSAAEKMRRYRERLKNENPEKYEEQRKKNLERIKSKKKNVSEMNNAEKAVQRQNWRRYQNKCRKKKLNDNQNHKDTEEEKLVQPQLKTSDSDKIIKRLNTKYKILQNKFRRHLNYMNKLNKLKEKYKKRHQRIKVESTKKIKMMEETINKMKAREEVLEHVLKNTYKNCKKHDDKRLFKQLIHNSSNKAYVAKLIGLKNGYIKGKKKTNGIKIIQEIRSFYMRDDVSRNTAGKKQTKTKRKDKKQIRYLLDSLVNLHKKYIDEGGRYGFTTFFKQKPFFILSPHIHSRETCACIKHSNFNFLFVALKQHGILKHSKHSELLNQLVCNTENYSCMYSNCKTCARREIEIAGSYQTEKNKLATWNQWERKDHTYFKSNSNDQQLIKTKKTVKSTKTGTIEELFKTFESSIKLYKKHHYNMHKQLKEYQNAVATLKDNEALIVCDFSENFEAKLSEEIQAMHFGASKSQITLHTGMIYWKNMSQSFCTISDSNNHQPPAIWAHLTPILDLIKENSPNNVNVIHFFSDGPTSQYRQKNNFYLLIHFTKEYDLQSSTWSFFESGHGKSVADGIGGCIKRILDKKICYGFDITNAMDAYTVLQSTVKNVKVFLIEEEKVAKIAEILPNSLIPIKGTMNLHHIITTTETNTIKFRDVSCFCEPSRGDCKCFSPQNHTILQPIYDDDKENISIPSTSGINAILFKHNSDKLPLKIVATDNQDTAQLRDFIDMYSIENDYISISNCSQNEGESDLMNIELLPLILLPDKELNTDPENKLNITKEGVKNISTITKFTKTFSKCHKCSCSILGKIIRCLSCKNVYCDDCIEGPTYFDYICDACFADED